MLHNASFVCQSRDSFLNAWENTEVTRAITSMLFCTMRWRHGRSRGETKYSCNVPWLKQGNRSGMICRQFVFRKHFSYGGYADALLVADSRDVWLAWMENACIEQQDLSPQHQLSPLAFRFVEHFPCFQFPPPSSNCTARTARNFSLGNILLKKRKYLPFLEVCELLHFRLFAKHSPNGKLCINLLCVWGILAGSHRQNASAPGIEKVKAWQGYCVPSKRSRFSSSCHF